MFSRKLIPAWIGIIVLSGMFLMGQGDECPWGTEVVGFPDETLEYRIRLKISKPSGPICASDLERLTELDFSYAPISDLTGLEYCTGLVTLNLLSNQISDLSPLAGLTNLTGLVLIDNQISDPSPLAGLTRLGELWLLDNQISDIGPLAGLTELDYLSLAVNQISDIYPLVENSGIGSGDSIWLNNNPLDETSCTVYIPELQSRGVYPSYNPDDCL